MKKFEFNTRTVFQAALTRIETMARELQEEIIFMERWGGEAIINPGGLNPFANMDKLAEKQARLIELLLIAKYIRIFIKKINEKEDTIFVNSFKEWLKSDPFKNM